MRNEEHTVAHGERMTHYSDPPSDPLAAVTIERAVVRYPGADSVALDIAGAALLGGRRTALIGPNGAGKSTLLKAIVGLLPLARGTITVLDRPAGTCHCRIAYVPQRGEVDWRFPITAAEVALMGRDVHLRWPRRPSGRDRAIAAAALDEVGMHDLAGRHIADLSGGQQQRVFLARALAQQAELLLLDEPFAGVDTATEAVIFAVIDRLCAEGRTVVVATHDLTSLPEHFDQAIVLQRRVVASGSPAAVLRPEILAEAYGGPLALFHGIESPGRNRQLTGSGFGTAAARELPAAD